MRRIIAAAAAALVLLTGCVPAPKTPEQKASAAAKTRDEAFVETLGTGKLTDQWRLHAQPALGAVQSTSAVFDVDGGKVYRLGLGNNKRKCHVVIELVAKNDDRHSNVVAADSPRPGELSEWSYRLVYIVPADQPKPAKPELTPPAGAVLAKALDLSFSKVGIDRAVLESRIASAADDPHNADYGKLGICALKTPEK